MSPRILYVGKKSALRSELERLLQPKFPLKLLSEAERTLQAMREQESSVLVVDAELGSEIALPLLQEAAEAFPPITQILLCNSADVSEALEAVGNGRLHYCVDRSLDPPLIALNLATAHERYLNKRRIAELEKRLVATERLYSLGVIAAGIAHEIRNPLAALQANLRLMQETMAFIASSAKQSEPEQLIVKVREAMEALEDCSSAAESIQEITRSVELTTRSSENETFDLREVVQLVLRSIQGELLEHREVRVLSSGELPPVHGSRNKMGQVVLNLVLNALEATRTIDCPLLGKVVIHLEPQGDCLLLTVEDNGPGIASEAQRRIFEPFFTTKTSGGTGLGLAISQRIVEEHGGRLEVSSEAGQGACFRVILPVAAAESAP